MITGAAKGICGAPLALRCSRAPAGTSSSSTVTIVASTRADASPVVAGDVTDRAVNESAVSLAEERFGRLDAVVANAGVNLARSLDDTTDEDIDPGLAVNLRALVYLAELLTEPSLALRGVWS